MTRRAYARFGLWLLLLGALPLMTPGLARWSGKVGGRLPGFLLPPQHVARLAHRRPATWTQRQLWSHQTPEIAQAKDPGRLVALVKQGSDEEVFPTCFEMELPTGYCLGVRMPSDPEKAALAVQRLQSIRGHATEVHPEEVAMVSGLGNVQAKLSFLGGRAALRKLLQKLYQGDHRRFDGAMPRDSFGAPVLPEGIFASISHKDDIAVGLVRHGKPDATTTVGVDLERCEPKRVSVAPRILTEAERARLGGLAGVGVSAESEVLLRFSLKEGLYKAIHPFVRRYVSFLEAEAEPAADGTCEFRLYMKNGEGPFDAQGWWQRVEGGRYFLTTVSVAQTSSVAAEQRQQRQPASTSAGRERR